MATNGREVKLGMKYRVSILKPGRGLLTLTVEAPDRQFAIRKAEARVKWYGAVIEVVNLNPLPGGGVKKG